uniref:Uncharacterized protein n=1 Tax=Kalmanozyma brasiliensis (strain GHG001) TaxID=1365824 RepID=V5GJX6_KALBG
MISETGSFGSVDSRPHSNGDHTNTLRAHHTGSSAGVTASLFSNWWGGGSTIAGVNASQDPGGGDECNAAMGHVTRLKDGKLSRKDLFKHLLSLRVTLSSAKLSWIDSFLHCDGLGALERIMQHETEGIVSSLIVHRTKQVERKDMSDAILLEAVKCLRTLMNIELGFEKVLEQSNLVNYIAFALRSPSYKLRLQVADVLAALCVLSLDDGHRMVCGALSELKIATGERFRFAFLVDDLKPDSSEDALNDAWNAGLKDANADEAIEWEYRAAAMVLVNAITNSPEDLEERVSLRDEFARRGLNEVLVSLRYVDPPESLATQIQVYVEEKQEDQDELHDRALHLSDRDRERDTDVMSDLGEAGEILRRSQDAHEDLYPIMISILRHTSSILDRDIDHQFKTDLLFVVDKYVEQSADVADFDEGWRSFMRSYLANIQHLVGKQAMIKANANRISDTSTVPSSFIEELEGLRAKVEELSDDKAKLSTRLNEQTAEVITLRSLPGAAALRKDSAEDDAASSGLPSSQPKRGDKESFAGVIHRLVAKEKQVIELQAELDRLSSAARPEERTDGDDRAKKERLERNRQWTNLMDEIARHKEQLAGAEANAEAKEREIKYLKRALETVYGRFQSGMAQAQEEAEAKDHGEEASKSATSAGNSEMEADMMARRTIEALSKKDVEISELRADVAKLQEKALQSMEAAKSTKEMEALQIQLGEIDRLDELFAIGSKPVAAVPDAKQAGQKAKPTTLLNLTRAQNVSIVLTRIRMPFAEMRAAILQCDESKLSIDHLKSINKCLPTTDELGLVRDYDGDIGTLSKADQFFKEMLGIPRLSERLACMVYMRTFELDLEEIKPDLRILKHAVDEINGSAKFKSVLHTVLTIGNVLNSSTFRGEAAGFQLSDLLKLRDTKPSQPTPATPTLLHYLVRVLNKTDKTLVGFLDDCSHVEAAARLSTTSVMASIAALITGHVTIKREMTVLQNVGISSQSDRFVDVTDEFLRQTSPQLKALQLVERTVSANLSKLLTYFGEDPSQTKPEDFFGLVSSFGQALMRAEEDTLQADRKAELEAQKKQKGLMGKGRFGTRVAQFGPEVRGPLAGVAAAAGGAGTQSTSAAETLDSPISDVTPTASRFQSSDSGSGGTLRADQSPAISVPADAARRSYRGRGQLDEAIKELRAGAAGRKLANVFANRDASPSPTKPSSRIFARPPPLEIDTTAEEEGDQMQTLEAGTIGRSRFSPATLRNGTGRDSIYGM